mmetsp:Transcript_78617/g.222252  ORF Transcript_78617/g.222252 Transcript_78617/m.222252 type:complete len:442 (+) Transcript_78617:414-1739(+)
MQDDVQRQGQVGRRTPAHAHRDRLVAPVKAPGVKPEEALEQRAGRGCTVRMLAPLARPHRPTPDCEARAELEALQGRQQGAVDSHLQKVDSQQRPSVGGQVALRGVAQATVFGPTPNKKDEFPRERLQAGALREERCALEWRHRIHGEVQWHSLVGEAQTCRRDEGDLRLLAAEGGAPELKGACADQAVGASADGRLLELLSIQLGRREAALQPATLQGAHQGLWAHIDHDVDLGNRHAKRGAARGVATGETCDLGLGQHRPDHAPHGLCNPCDCGVSLWRQGDAGEEFGHFRIPADSLEGRRSHGHGTGLAHLQPGHLHGLWQAPAAWTCRGPALHGDRLGAARGRQPGRQALRALPARLGLAGPGRRRLPLCTRLEALEQQVGQYAHQGREEVRDLQRHHGAYHGRHEETNVSHFEAAAVHKRVAEVSAHGLKFLGEHE